VRTTIEPLIRRLRRSAHGAIVALVLSGAASCRQVSAPIEQFTVTVEIPPAKGKPAPAPPEGALRPWRVWVNQERPRQKKAPEWRAFGAKDGAALDLAADGRWRCVVNPVRVLGKANERAQIADWIVSRTVRCSSDGWKTFVGTFVQVGFDSDGKETQSTPSAPVYLNDQVGGVERSTVVVLEGAKPARRVMVD